ncbi:MAG: fumarylacetoacetate hydrolase family protein [Phycisphaerales bacterium]|nr:fumarylacetoacetate hydrolase family protein [Phycisphaerales bacterium]
MKLTRLTHGVGIVMADGSTLPISHIIGIGRNYDEHAKEQGEVAPERPMIFTKNPAAACLDGDEIVIPPLCRDEETGGPEQVDYEAELGVILGRPARDVPLDDALGCVLAYTCVNDISARWWQKQGAGGQFCRGKSFDTFCPIGPRLVSPEELGDPQALRVICRVNGTVRQQDSTARMIHPVAGLISELSRGTTLIPGTLILTGTPSGVGMARKPPAYLKAGDRVEVEVEKIGILRNTVVDG